MDIIRAQCGQTARIAYQTENNRTQVRFDLSDIMNEFPGGTAVLTIRRPGDTEAVPSLSAEMEGTELVWTVTAWECERQGFLYAQVVYSEGETVAKTKIYRFSVSESLITTDGEEPDNWEDWVDELVEAAADTRAAVESYDEMTAAATGLPGGSSPTAEIDRTGENPVLRLGIPAGEDSVAVTVYPVEAFPCDCNRLAKATITYTVKFRATRGTTQIGATCLSGYSRTNPSHYYGMEWWMQKACTASQEGQIDIKVTEGTDPFTGHEPDSMICPVNFTLEDGSTLRQTVTLFCPRDGYTPERGVDYWTEADQTAMRQDIASDVAAARQAINDEKVLAVGAVETAGTTQVGLVTDEGTAQKAAVVAQGQATIASIPSDYTNLSNDVSDLKSAIQIIETEEVYPENTSFFNSTNLIDFAKTDYDSLFNVSGIVAIRGHRVLDITNNSSSAVTIFLPISFQTSGGYTGKITFTQTKSSTNVRLYNGTSTNVAGFTSGTVKSITIDTSNTYNLRLYLISGEHLQISSAYIVPDDSQDYLKDECINKTVENWICKKSYTISPWTTGTINSNGTIDSTATTLRISSVFPVFKGRQYSLDNGKAFSAEVIYLTNPTIGTTVPTIILAGNVTSFTSPVDGYAVVVVSSSYVTDYMNCSFNVANETEGLLKGNFVTPEMFGAVGDGATDDAESIQYAVDTGKIVLFGNKTYCIGTTVSISSDTSLIGGTNTVLKAIGAISYIISASGTNVSINGITFDGNVENITATTHTCLRMENCVSKVTDCTFKNGKNHHITVSGGNGEFSNILFKNIYDTGSSSDTYITGSGSTIWNNVRSEIDEYDSVNTSQTFYIHNGEHIINGLITKNIYLPFDIRNGKTTITNIFADKCTSIKQGTSDEKEGAEVVVENAVLNMIYRSSVFDSLIFVNAVKSFELHNVKITATLQENVNAPSYVIKVNKVNDSVINRVLLDNVQFDADGIATNMMLFGSIVSGTVVILSNVKFPTVTNTNSYLYSKNNCDFVPVFENCQFTLNRKHGYDQSASDVDYAVEFRRMNKTWGASTNRPNNLGPLDIAFYKDTTLNKVIMWNGTKWVNTDGSNL